MRWEFTVEVFNVGKALAEEGLPNAMDSRQPDHGAFTPRLLDEFLPEVSLHHMHVLLHKVLLNESEAAFGTETPRNSWESLPGRRAVRIMSAEKKFDYEAKKIFDKPDSAKLKKDKTLKDAGDFLQNNRLSEIR